MFKFEELNVYQESLKFATTMYSLTRKWPREEVFGLTSQVRRASVSITLNIAEGSSRSKKEFQHFLDMSRGSCFECITILSIAKQQLYITQEDYSAAYETCDKLSRMLSNLKISLR